MFQNDRRWGQQVRIAGYKIHQMRYKYFWTDNTRYKWENKKNKDHVLKEEVW